MHGERRSLKGREQAEQNPGDKSRKQRERQRGGIDPHAV